MSVADCMYEYENLGGRVFGRPNLLHTQRLLVTNIPKYNAKELERVFRDVTERRAEGRDGVEGIITFHVREWENLCKT
jgi:hypothetical protein